MLSCVGLTVGGCGLLRLTASRREAGCPLKNGGIHMRILPRLEVVDSSTNRRPAASKAMPAGVANAVSEVNGFDPEGGL